MAAGDILALTASPGLNGLIWAVAVMAIGYLARQPAHALIHVVAVGVRRLFRLLARYCAHAEVHVRAWARATLVANAQRRALWRADWNVERLEEELRTGLADLPPLQQHLRDHLSRVEADYRSSGAVPPEIPGWPKMLENLGPELGAADPSVKQALQDLRDGLETQRADLLDAYRRAARRRYLLLHRTMPHWRRVRRALERMTERLDQLQDRAERVLGSIRAYEALRSENRVRIGVLAGGALWRFGFSVMGLALAALGFAMLWHLIVEPVVALLGNAPLAEGFPGRGQAATVLLLGTIALLGLLLLETTRVTHLFPGIDAMGEGVRRWLFWLAYTCMVLLAVACAALQVRFGGPLEAIPAMDWEEAAAMGLEATLVLVLPFALVFAGVPVAGAMAHGGATAALLLALVLQVLMLTFRLLGSLAAFAGAVLVQVYDLIIFLPLWIEDMIRTHGWRVSRGLVPLRRRLPAPRAGG